MGEGELHAYPSIGTGSHCLSSLHGTRRFMVLPSRGRCELDSLQHLLCAEDFRTGERNFGG